MYVSLSKLSNFSGTVHFNCTAKDWRENNKEQARQGLNIRDFASINELAVLSNLESMNAEMIKSNIPKIDRFKKLKNVANYQLNILSEKNLLKSIKKLTDETYINYGKKLKGKK